MVLPFTCSVTSVMLFRPIKAQFSGVKWYLYSCPCFSKVRFMLPCFYKRPALVPGFVNQNKSKRIFHFYKQSWKAKIAFRVCRAARRALTGSFPRNYSQRLSVQLSEISTVSLSMCASSRLMLCMC